MGWEWIPLATASVGASATVAVAYLGFRHAARMAKDRSEHERNLAADARVQQRLADAYVEILEVVQRMGQWAALVRPMLDTDPPREPPAIPSLQEQARAEALISAFASDAVQDLMKTWRATLNKIRGADMTIAFGQARPSDRLDIGDHWRKLDMEYRPEESAAREALVEQIANELGHRFPRVPA